MGFKFYLTSLMLRNYDIMHQCHGLLSSSTFLARQNRREERMEASGRRLHVAAQIHRSRRDPVSKAATKRKRRRRREETLAMRPLVPFFLRASSLVFLRGSFQSFVKQELRGTRRKRSLRVRNSRSGASFNIPAGEIIRAAWGLFRRVLRTKP